MTRSLAAALVIALLELAAPPDIQAQAQIERRQLATTIVIDGITCAPTGRASAEFYPSGRLAECPIAADTVLFGHALPKGTWVGFTEDGRLANGCASAFSPRTR